MAPSQRPFLRNEVPHGDVSITGTYMSRVKVFPPYGIHPFLQDAAPYFRSRVGRQIYLSWAEKGKQKRLFQYIITGQLLDIFP